MKDKKAKPKSSKKIMSFYLPKDLCDMIDDEVNELSSRDNAMDINRNRLVENILKRHYAIKSRMRGETKDSNEKERTEKFMEKNSKCKKFDLVNFNGTTYLEVPSDQIESMKLKLSTFSFFDQHKKCYYLNTELDAPLFVKNLRSQNFNVVFSSPKKMEKSMPTH